MFCGITVRAPPVGDGLVLRFKSAERLDDRRCAFRFSPHQQFCHAAFRKRLCIVFRESRSGYSYAVGQAGGLQGQTVQGTAANVELRIESGGLCVPQGCYRFRQKHIGILGNVSGSSVSQDLNMSIQMSDFKSLAEFLRTKDISAEDISELERAIKDDPKPESPKSLGKRVSSWIGKMITKAASGAWDIGVQAAGTILTNAISIYYGFKI